MACSSALFFLRWNHYFLQERGLERGVTMLKSITSQVDFYKEKGGQVEYFAVSKFCKAFGRVKFFFAVAIAIVIVMVIHSENRT